jgi:septin family protein
MGLLICRFCIEPGVQKNVIILGQSGTGKTIALYQLLDPNLVSAEIKPKLTSGRYNQFSYDCVSYVLFGKRIRVRLFAPTYHSSSPVVYVYTAATGFTDAY